MYCVNLVLLDEVSGKSESAQVEKGDSESSAKNHDKEPGQRKKTSEELEIGRAHV